MFETTNQDIYIYMYIYWTFPIISYPWYCMFDGPWQPCHLRLPATATTSSHGIMGWLQNDRSPRNVFRIWRKPYDRWLQIYIYILYHSNIILIYLYIIIFIIFIIFIYVHSNLISPEQWLVPKVNEQFLSIHDLEVSGFLPPAKARSGDGNAVGDMRMVLQLLEESGKEGLQSAKLTRSGSSHRKLVGFTYINSW